MAGTGIRSPAVAGTSADEAARCGGHGRPRWARRRGGSGPWRVWPTAAAPISAGFCRLPPTPIPDGLARAGDFACPCEPPTDRADGPALAADPVPPLADHPGGIGHHVIVGRPHGPPQT
jgi:hypothetical protein